MFESMDDDDLKRYQEQMTCIYTKGAGVSEMASWVIGAIFFLGTLARLFERADTFDAVALVIGAAALWFANDKDRSRKYYKQQSEAAQVEITRRRSGDHC